MGFYYVKAGGTATGDAGRTDTARTGSFAAMGVSACYDSIYDVFGGGVPATPPDGDNIVFSADHTEIYTANTVLGVGSVTTDNVITLISVDPDDVALYKKSTSDTIFNANTATVFLGSYSEGKNGAVWIGATITAKRITVNTRDGVVFKDCDLTCINDFIYSTLGKFTLIDSNLYCTYIRGYSEYINSNITLYNPTYAIRDSNDVHFYNCDLSNSSSHTIAQSVDKVYFNRCKLPPALLTLLPQDTTTDYFEYKITGSHSTDDFFNESYRVVEGFISIDKDIYLSHTISTILESLGDASIFKPLRYKLVELPAQDLTSDKTYTVNFQSDTTLKDADFWLEVVRPDENDLALGVMDTTRPDNILSDGVEHDTNAESWSGLTPANQYEESITVSAMAGVDNANVENWVNLALPNVDVWVCPEVEFS